MVPKISFPTCLTITFISTIVDQGKNTGTFPLRGGINKTVFPRHSVQYKTCCHVDYNPVNVCVDLCQSWHVGNVYFFKLKEINSLQDVN